VQRLLLVKTPQTSPTCTAPLGGSGDAGGEAPGCRWSIDAVLPGRVKRELGLERRRKRLSFPWSSFPGCEFKSDPDSSPARQTRGFFVAPFSVAFNAFSTKELERWLTPLAGDRRDHFASLLVTYFLEAATLLPSLPASSRYSSATLQERAALNQPQRAARLSPGARAMPRPRRRRRPRPRPSTRRARLPPPSSRRWSALARDPPQQ
jgi:hypothetical protein